MGNPLVILLVEDVYEDAKLFEKFMFSDMEVQVHLVTTLTAALKIDASEELDLTILDLNLPPDSSVYNTIDNIPLFRSKVIVLTAMPDFTLQSKSIAAGAVGFFHKLQAISERDKFIAAVKSIMETGKTIAFRTETEKPTP